MEGSSKLYHLPSSVSRGSKSGKGKGMAFMACGLLPSVLADQAPPPSPFPSFWNAEPVFAGCMVGIVS